MLTDDDFDSVMGEILIPEESEPMKPGTVICTTFNEGHDEEEDEEKDVWDARPADSKPPF